MAPSISNFFDWFRKANYSVCYIHHAPTSKLLYRARFIAVALQILMQGISQDCRNIIIQRHWVPLYYNITGFGPINPIICITMNWMNNKLSIQSFNHAGINILLRMIILIIKNKQLSLSLQIPSTHLLTESEWRNLGVQQSPGWVHYMIHPPEKHILLFRRAISTTSRATQAVPPQELQVAGAWLECLESNPNVWLILPIK